MLGALWVNACDYFILKLFNKEVFYKKKKKTGEIYDFLKDWNVAIRALNCSYKA